MTSTDSSKPKLPTPSLTISVEGVDVNYTAHILPNRQPTVVLIHGFGASLETWSDIYPLLNGHYSVIRMDLKGSGFSSKPRDNQYTPTDQAHLVLEFLRAMNQRNVILVGHSLGGGVALLSYFQSATSHDIRVNGLVLIASAGYSRNLPFFVSAVRNPFTRCLSRLIPARERARLVLERVCMVKGCVTPEMIDKYAFFLDMPGSQYALCQTAKQIIPDAAAQLHEKFQSIRVPVLILWGENDPVIPPDDGHRFNQSIPQSRLVMLHDTGHIPQEERPTEAFAVINEFLESVR